MNYLQMMIKTEIFFDKKYDPTRYEIMESFQEMKLMGDTVNYLDNLYFIFKNM